MTSQADKVQALRDLHARPGAFLIPNPWDIGSARILQGLGFEALATTSGGFAFSHGRLDYGVTREQVIEHLALICPATELPVSADLENGFGDAPEAAAETIRLAAAAGVAGGSIEDATTRADDPIYDIGLATDRIRAAVEAARAQPAGFVLTARAENYLHGRPDLADTIRRLQAFQAAGADVLYAPGLTDLEEIATLVREVDRPVNVLAAVGGLTATAAELAAVGVKRISIGGALARAAYGALIAAAQEMQGGEFGFVSGLPSSARLGQLFGTT